MQITALSSINYFRGRNSSQINSYNRDRDCIDYRTRQNETRDLSVFNQHIYEYKKGIRPLVLTTENIDYQDTIENKLNKFGIDYHITQISPEKINVFFGDKSCVDVAKTFNEKLYKLSPEQDFILGTLLGYDKSKQCERYLNLKQEQKFCDYRA